MRMHHVGIACKDINKAVVEYEKNHNVISKSEIVYDELQDAELIYLRTSEGVDVEFISGRQVENIVSKGINYYHLCFEVNDIETEIKKLVSNRAFIVSPAKPSVLFNNRKVAFLYTSNGLIELLEA